MICTTSFLAGFLAAAIGVPALIALGLLLWVLVKVLPKGGMIG